MNTIHAQNDKWLTQRQVADNSRIFVKNITGVSATLEYWQEVSEEEKEQWEAEHPQPEESQDNE